MCLSSTEYLAVGTFALSTQLGNNTRRASLYLGEDTEGPMQVQQCHLQIIVEDCLEGIFQGVVARSESEAPSRYST